MNSFIHRRNSDSTISGYLKQDAFSTKNAPSEQASSNDSSNNSVSKTSTESLTKASEISKSDSSDSYFNLETPEYVCNGITAITIVNKSTQKKYIDKNRIKLLNSSRSGRAASSKLTGRKAPIGKTRTCRRKISSQRSKLTHSQYSKTRKAYVTNLKAQG